MEHRKDIMEQIVELGDTVCWNPVKYKGLVFGIIVDFQKGNGLPIVLVDKQFQHRYLGNNAGQKHQYVPKTGFILIKEKQL